MLFMRLLVFNFRQSEIESTELCQVEKTIFRWEMTSYRRYVTSGCKMSFAETKRRRRIGNTSLSIENCVCQTGSDVFSVERHFPLPQLHFQTGSNLFSLQRHSWSRHKIFKHQASYFRCNVTVWSELEIFKPEVTYFRRFPGNSDPRFPPLNE